MNSSNIQRILLFAMTAILECRCNNRQVAPTPPNDIFRNFRENGLNDIPSKEMHFRRLDKGRDKIMVNEKHIGVLTFVPENLKGSELLMGSGGRANRSFERSFSSRMSIPDIDDSKRGWNSDSSLDDNNSYDITLQNKIKISTNINPHIISKKFDEEQQEPVQPGVNKHTDEVIRCQHKQIEESESHSEMKNEGSHSSSDSGEFAITSGDDENLQLEER
jgi:hypothetical protein